MIDFHVDRYTLTNLLGEGNFGFVYKAIDHKTSSNVAIKIEKPSKFPQIHIEIEVLQSLNTEPGFPKLIDFGKCDGNSYMVMTLLGSNLQKKLLCIKKVISSETLIEIGIKCFQRIKCMHDHYYIHRDLKPHQFLIEEDLKVSLIDFGLSKKYFNNKLMLHIPYTDNRPFVGTANYASVNTHNGIQQSRRDDLESFCYILSYMVNGRLPWISETREKFDEKAIKRIKTNITPSQLFNNSSLIKLFQYTKSLSFEVNPDYAYMLELLTQAKHEEKSSSISMISIDGSTNSCSKVVRKRRSKKSTIKSLKFRRSKLCRSLDNFSFLDEDPEKTVISDQLPEFKDRTILKPGIGRTIENHRFHEKSSCLIV